MFDVRAKKCPCDKKMNFSGMIDEKTCVFTCQTPGLHKECPKTMSVEYTGMEGLSLETDIFCPCISEPDAIERGEAQEQRLYLTEVQMRNMGRDRHQYQVLMCPCEKQKVFIREIVLENYYDHEKQFGTFIKPRLETDEP